MDTLTILILSIHEHEIFFHLLVSSSISFSNVLLPSVYRSFAFLVKVIPKYFIVFAAIINGLSTTIVVVRFVLDIRIFK